MAYGIIKIDTITFTDGGIDKSVSISGLVQNPTFTGNITVTGTVSGNTVRGQTISGVTITGTTAQFTSGTFVSLTGTTLQGTTATYTTGSFTSLTGTTTSGTTANFVSGVFSTQISGATVTGTTANFTSGNFTNISGGTHTITSGVFAAGTAANPSISFTSDPNTGIYSPGADQVAISTNGTGRLFVDASGNVGIGAASSGSLLDLAVLPGATSQDGVKLSSSGQAGFFAFTGNSYTYRGVPASSEMLYSSTNMAFLVDAAANITWHNNGGERMRLDSSGRLGLGTSSVGSYDFDGPTVLAVANTAGSSSLAVVSDAASLGQIAFADGTSSTARYRGLFRYNHSTDSLEIRTAAVPAVIIDSSQRVGIGTSAPSSLLHLVSSGQPTITVADADGRTLQVKSPDNSSNPGFIGTTTNHDLLLQAGITAGGLNVMRFNTAGAERVRITDTGAVGIGTTDPRFSVSIGSTAGAGVVNPDTLDLGGTYSSVAGANAKLRVYWDGTDTFGLGVSPGQLEYTVPSSSSHVFYRGTTQSAKIDGSGRLLVGTSTARETSTVTWKSQIEGANELTGLGITTNQNGGAAAYLSLAKSRGTTIGSNTIVQADDALGAILFSGADGTDANTQAATIICAVDGTPGANDMPGRLVFSTTADGASSPTERMRLDSSGRLGLGTSSPTAPLTIAYSGAEAQLQINNSGNNRMVYLGAYSANEAILRLFNSSNVETVRIPAESTAGVHTFFNAGNVGIGTTSPSYSLDVQGAAAVGVGAANGNNYEFRVRAGTSGLSRFIAADTSDAGYIDYDHSDNSWTFRTNGSEACRIDSSRRLLVGTSSSTTDDTLVLQGNSTGATGSAQLWLKRNATLSSGTGIGDINFGKGANTGAKIGVFADANWTDGSSHPSRLVFSTTADGASSPTQAVRINSLQQMLIGSGTGGSYSSITKFQVDFSSNNDFAAAFVDSGSAADAVMATFYKAGAVRGQITTSSTATTYATSSDYRLKENVVLMQNAISRLQELKPCRFNFKHEPLKTVDGFIAHEAQAVVPECVTGTKDEVDDDGNPVYQGIDQSKLVPLLTAALQEALAEIESLKARVTALEP
jgi:hypothetical protein